MVVVTTPQRAAQKVAVRVADMARRSHMPVVGVIENMSSEVFGSGGGDELAEELGVPMIASVPLEGAVVTGGDTGNPVAGDPDSHAGRVISAATARLVELVPPADQETCTGRIAKLLAELDEGAA
jgi:ATP-binding protein involved in chromosome partitioning